VVVPLLAVVAFGRRAATTSNEFQR